MSIAVFYAPNAKDSSYLSEEESFHAIRVLRLKVGEVIHLLDGRGSKYSTKISTIEGKKVSFGVLELIDSEPKPSYTIHLYVAPTKQMERMEWMVEKCGEFGIHGIHFFASKHSERKEIKLHRLEKTAISALKQSKNLYLPKITGLHAFKEIAAIEGEEKLFAFISNPPVAELSKTALPGKEYHVLVGPEGDFTPEESATLKNNQWKAFSLGKSILRTETAGIAVCHGLHILNID
ncbi:RsmE family RNA methyltransferase [Aquirufa sp. 2-AUSEE-184A6]|uniref:Ribosomal RNA small subunit methyltransferase E n=1 Tax=Aquirufa novilacunae TaxID=3139305 RepID=A0ABW8STD6_9BACT